MIVTPILNRKEIICHLPGHLGTCEPSHVGSTALKGTVEEDGHQDLWPSVSSPPWASDCMDSVAAWPLQASVSSLIE